MDLGPFLRTAYGLCGGLPCWEKWKLRGWSSCHGSTVCLISLYFTLPWLQSKGQRQSFLGKVKQRAEVVGAATRPWPGPEPIL